MNVVKIRLSLIKGVRCHPNVHTRPSKFAFICLISVSSLFTLNNSDKQAHKYLINCCYTLAKQYLIGSLINIFALG